MKEEIMQRIKALVEENNLNANRIARTPADQRRLNRQLNEGCEVTLPTVIDIIGYLPSVSAEWLLRGEGEKYNTDVPRDTDTEEVADLRAELTRVHAERDELRQVVDDLKRQAKEWRESDEYKQTIAELRAEAADLRARLDEQRNNFRVLAESIGRQPQQPVIAGSAPRINIAHAVAAAATANMPAGVPAAIAIGDAASLPGAIAAKATK